jgi:hypothetical protein
MLDGTILQKLVLSYIRPFLSPNSHEMYTPATALDRTNITG